MSHTRLAAIVVPIVLALAAFVPSGPAAAATAPHSNLERYVLRLINCTRTGGWVLKDGTCKDYGSGKHSAYRKPLTLSSSLSNRLSRPYAIRIAAAVYCGHGLGGRTIVGAFHKAGFHAHHFGENIGCGNWSNPKEDVLQTHLLMQAERGTGQWHWRHLKDPGYRTIGIGVAVVNGTTRVVEDFYQPGS